RVSLPFFQVLSSDSWFPFADVEYAGVSHDSKRSSSRTRKPLHDVLGSDSPLAHLTPATNRTTTAPSRSRMQSQSMAMMRITTPAPALPPQAGPSGLIRDQT